MRMMGSIVGTYWRDRAMTCVIAPTLFAALLSATAVARADPRAVESKEDSGYEIVQGPPPRLRVGQHAAVSLSLLPRGGHRLLADGPLLVRLGGDGVKPERPLYRRDDAVDPHAEAPRFELGFVLERASAKLTARCTFYLCRAGRCHPVETEVSWTLPGPS